MTPRTTIAALRKETEELLARFGSRGQGDSRDTRKAIDLIARSRLALALLRDDGLGPWESPELEYALHIATRHELPRLALICALEVLVMGEKSLGVMSDHGFLALLA